VTTTYSAQLVENFRNLFHQAPLLVKSPGRVNIIGEHTDYNGGYVLPAAIDKAVQAAVSLRDDNMINLVATDLDEIFSVSLEDIKPVSKVSWPNYILGAAAQFQKRGLLTKGFNAVISSDVPIGAGLSSSAAVECAMVYALNELLQTKLDKLTMVQMAQKAEHEYAGVMCGIMDQFASMFGKKDHVIKLDCDSLSYEYIPFKLDGIKVLLLNTNVKHSLASSEYNIRRNECEIALGWIKKAVPGVETLRSVNESMIDEQVENRNGFIARRSRYVVQEMERLQGACEDLKRGDIPALGKKMFATHDGLSRMYEVSCKELDWLVDHVRTKDAVIGARLMGGGFGGCTINLVKEDAIDELIAELKPAYEREMELPLSYYVASIENGTEMIADYV
jgi:galactokinase